MNLMRMACRSVVTLDVSDHCRRAAELMSRFQIRHLPVLDEGMAVGMVSDRDLLSSIGWWNSDPQHPDTTIPDWADQIPVDEIMSQPLICLAPDDSPEKAARLMLPRATITEAARAMTAAKIGALPVCDQTRLVGIITETDLVKALLASSDEQPM